MWRAGSVAALVCLVSGLLPLDAAGDVARRMAPILLFLLVALLATVTTVLLGLDTTAADAGGAVDVGAAGPAGHAARAADRRAGQHRQPAAVGLEPHQPARAGPPGAAAALVVVFAVRRPRVLRFGLVPWRLAVFVLGLALAVETVLRHGGHRVVASVAGEGTGVVDLLQVAGVGAATSNLVNNLPAYLVIEPQAAGGGDVRLLALLVGTNVGPMVRLWGSLATLLWRERCRARGIEVSARQFATFGLVGVPIVLVATTLALTVTGT